MRPVQMNNEEPERDEQSSSPARPRGPKRVRRGSNTPTTDGQVPQYIPKVKSCVSCRQQKIKCDVVREPFEPCSHCKRMKRECKIDLEFKRVAKRDQLEHLHQQITDLKQQLELAKRIPATLPDTPQDDPSTALTSKPQDQVLGNISLPGVDVASLFDIFFESYHQYCPILDPEITSDTYFDVSLVLGWTVILVAARRNTQDGQLLSKLTAPYHRLLWATISEMPQTYHTVKALALLCTWPIPSIPGMSSNPNSKKIGPGLNRLGLSELDPTFILSGIMMQIAMQTGLHVSSHAQEFIQQIRSIGRTETEDRQLTWAVCNIVSQSVAITYGKPSRSSDDCDLALDSWAKSTSLTDIEHRLTIAKFCHKFTSCLYKSSSDFIGWVREADVSSRLSQLNADLQELESLSIHFSPFNKLSLLAAKVHFNTYAFYLPSSSPIRINSISAAYNSAIAFIQGVLDPDMHSSSLLHYCTNFVLRTLISASCVLLKILNSSIAVHLDAVQGKTMFNACILALRSTSLKKNDFPDRVAEAQTRMWRVASGGFDAQANALGLHAREQEDPLELKIRSRMCVSHIYDCVWSWRRSINSQQAADEDSSTAMRMDQAQIPDQETGLFQYQQIGDFDLFNSLDWSFDESVPFSWS